MLTSPKNPTIQHIRKLQSQSRYRKETGLFVIEGERLLGECLAAGVKPEILLHTGPADRPLLDAFSTLGVEPVEVSEPAMQAASDTQAPQGVLAVVPIPKAELPAALSFVVVLDGLRDPGNLGGILRTAWAAGAGAVLLTPGSADPYQPKVVRSGMGAHFHLPVRQSEWGEIEGLCAGLAVYQAEADGAKEYTEADFKSAFALVIGGEAHGAGERAAALKPETLRIPMPGGAESLNAAVAAGILMFEAVRQRG